MDSSSAHRRGDDDGGESGAAAGVMRHLLAMLLLPTMATVVVPWSLMRAELSLARTLAVSSMAGTLALRAAGAVTLLAGLSLFVWCVRLFGRVGHGTLAPWDPTRRLVAVGPYRHVRNPMIGAVAFVLAGEALWCRSPRLAAWFAIFVAINHVYFLVSEEPGLLRRFGADYAAYRDEVPRWVPRWRPWRPGPPSSFSSAK